MCACRSAQPEPVGDSCAPTRKRAQAGELVGPQQADQQRRRDHRRGGQRQQEPRRHPADDQHRPGEHGEQHRGAEVRLKQGEADGHDREQQGQREALPGRPARAQDGGEDEQQPELGQLGGLEGEGAERDPPGGAVRGQAAHEDADQEEDRRAVGDPAQDAEVARPDPPEHREGEHPDGGDHALPHGEVRFADQVQVGQSERGQHQRGHDGEQVERAAAEVPPLLPGPPSARPPAPTADAGPVRRIGMVSPRPARRSLGPGGLGAARAHEHRRGGRGRGLVGDGDHRDRRHRRQRDGADGREHARRRPGR